MNGVIGQEKLKPPTRRELLDLLQRAADEMAATSASRDSLILREIRATLARVKP